MKPVTKPWSVSARLIFISGGLLLAGCASLQDMRSQPAQMSTVVRGDYAAMAECFSARTDEIRHRPAVLRLNRTLQRANVYEHLQDQVASYDYTFIQDGENVRVEARGMDTIFGKDHHPKSVWHLIGECASRQ